MIDTFGVPVADTTYRVDFRLYGVPTGGGSLWDETQNVVTRGGLLAFLLGSVTAIGSGPDADSGP